MSAEFGYIVAATTIAIAALIVWAIVAWPQKRARQRQEQVVSELKVGEEIVTVGGIIGKLTYLNREEDLAKIEVAKGIEIRMIPAAISHPLNILQRLAAAEAAETAKGKGKK